MKKLVIFLSLALMFLFVGCNKEDIRPNASDDSDSISIFEKGNMNEDSTNDDDDGKPDNPITDPNHDEDEDEKIKR